MSLFEITSLVAAFALGASRLLVASKPFWTKLPPVVATFVPAVVVMLPQLASSMGAVHSELDFVQALILAAAMLLPGAAAKH